MTKPAVEALKNILTGITLPSRDSTPHVERRKMDVNQVEMMLEYREESLFHHYISMATQYCT